MTTSDQMLSVDVLMELKHTLEHFNANHADTVLLLARYAAGHSDALTADAASVDSTGVNLAVTNGTGTVVGRLQFDQPASTATDVQIAIVSMIGEARERAGEEMPETSMERELRVVPALPTFITSVEEVSDITPNLRQVTLRDNLEEFVPLGGDHFAYLMIPNTSMNGHFPAGFSMNDQRSLPEAERLDGAYYTIRDWDPAHHTITLWIVLHDHPTGIAAWARECQSGDEVALWGPRGSISVPEPTGEYLLVTDESGFAAVASLVEQVDGRAPVSIIAETISASHIIEFPHRPNLDVIWIFRGSDAPGTGERLLGAVKNATFDRSTTTAFGAGESREITTIRKFLRDDLQLSAENVYFTGYWRSDS